MIQVDLPERGSLLDFGTEIPFGCRAAACGRCSIRVHEGAESLAPESERETRAKAILKINGAQARLACQVRAVRATRLTFEPLSRRRTS